MQDNHFYDDILSLFINYYRQIVSIFAKDILDKTSYIMKRLLIITFLFSVFYSYGQSITNLETLAPDKEYTNIWSTSLYENEEASYYLIWIDKSVKMHKHDDHTESLTILSGEGIMTVGDTSFIVTKGDFFVVPKGTYHSLQVTSQSPIKCVSIQMPKFNPADRIFKEE